MAFLDEYKKWCNDEYFDEATRQELLAISNDSKEIEERFYKSLEFGTGGLRGILGAGTNRMNIYTVSKATQGFANYIISQGNDAVNKGVAIAYDSRNCSALFAEVTARVLAGNGIKAYLSDELRPVPMLSFALRELGCVGGVVITASHNPPEYNGYKVYWEDGAQVPTPRDGEIIKKVNEVTDFNAIKWLELSEGINNGLIEYFGPEIDIAYNKAVNSEVVNKATIDNTDLRIVYTPLHGSGNKPVRRALAEAGFKDVFVVKSQEMPDGNFPTVGYPNPENKAVFDLAMDLAKKVDADIIVGTDPDADRLGAVVKKNDGDYLVLTGNMTGALICDYILSQGKLNNSLPSNGAVISTIVSTNMTRAICHEYGVKYFEVLTGFKYIGEKIKDFELDNSYKYLFGFEESYGCLSGTYARDKDAINATMLICEIAAFYKAKGMSLYDGLIELYNKYGYFMEKIISIELKGIDGAKQMQRIMDTLRQSPLTELAGVNVAEVRDYLTGDIKNMATGESSSTELPSSNVLYYTLDNEAWLCIRPSGTEPKIKVYTGCKSASEQEANNCLKTIEDSFINIVEKIK